jgi:hypothetical protein
MKTQIENESIGSSHGEIGRPAMRKARLAAALSR